MHKLSRVTGLGEKVALSAKSGGADMRAVRARSTSSRLTLLHTTDDDEAGCLHVRSRPARELCDLESVVLVSAQQVDAMWMWSDISSLSTQFASADYFVQWTVPWICDCALLFKLLAFHPAPTTPWKRRAAIMAFPLAMHVPRMPLLAASLVLARANPEGIVVEARNQARLLVVEGALQVAQNCYCSGFLLYKVSIMHFR